MGEAKRRRQLGRTIKQINEEGAGVLQIAVITRPVFAELMARSIRGNSQATQLLRAVPRFLEQLHTTTPRMLCLLCDAELSAVGAALPEAFVIFQAYRDDPNVVLCNGICAGCCDRPYP